MAPSVFPTLFKRTSTGAIEQWRIWVEGSTIHTEHGQVGGKLQVGADVVRKGKNLGKLNSTTPEEQATLEATAKWTKKMERNGYVQSLERAQQGETDHQGGVNPMLAHKYAEQSAKIKWPAYAQPKLDGSRCIAVYQDGVCTLWSRTRKPITGVPHIARAVEKLLEGKDSGTVVLDGELYNQSFKDDFETIMHFVRQQEPAEGHEVVEYHVYDLASGGKLSFQERSVALMRLFGKLDPHPLVMVDTRLVETPDDLTEAFGRWSALGYEGAMVRNADGAYEGKRSYNLQKVKSFLDDEFKVVGIEEGRGRLQGHVGAFVCQDAQGQEFRAKMSGDTQALKAWWEGPREAWLGKSLTVKYQGLTGKNGVPRFPVGLRFREEP